MALFPLMPEWFCATGQVIETRNGYPFPNLDSVKMIVEFPVTVPHTLPLERDYINPPDVHDTYADLYGYGSERPEVFAPHAPDLEGTSLEGVVTTLPGLLKTVAEGGAPRMLELLSAAGVDAAIVHSFDTLSHDIVADVQKASNGRLVGIAGASPFEGTAGIRKLDIALREKALQGVSVQPYANGIHADDRRYYPIYSKCAEYDVPLVVHTSTNLLAGVRNDCGHPSHLDQVATDFPELKIVAHHGGWPWVLEMVSIALRHPNMYISPAGMRPRHFAKPGAGWLPLLQFGDTLLRDRILWGSNWPLLPIRRSHAEIRDLPLREETLDAWLGNNAARLFNLERYADSARDSSASATI